MFEGPIRYLAGATFSIYLFHAPILALMQMAFWGRNPTLGRSVCLYTILFAVLLVLAELTERRKAVWTRFFTKLCGQTSAPCQLQVRSHEMYRKSTEH